MIEFLGVAEFEMKSDRVFFSYLYAIPGLMLTERGHLRSFRAVVCLTIMMEKERHREGRVRCKGVTVHRPGSQLSRGKKGVLSLLWDHELESSGGG